MLTWNLAVIDLVIMRHLFQQFPDATSGQLSAARSRAVCGPTLASVAVNRLGLHKHLLINNVELSTAITRHVPLLETLSPEDAILKGWKYDPPKALSDVLESLVGAVLVDSAYNFEKTALVVEVVMSDVLAVLTTNLPRDPVSELMVWAATGGCKRIAFQQVPQGHSLIRTDNYFSSCRKSQSNAELRRNDSVSVIVHEHVVAGPITASNLSLSKGLAAERARAILGDPSHEMSLVRLCDCRRAAEERMDICPEPPGDQTSQKVTDETEEGFASIALHKLEEDYSPLADATSEEVEDELGEEMVSSRI